jgi:hypothetical protein
VAGFVEGAKSLLFAGRGPQLGHGAAVSFEHDFLAGRRGGKSLLDAITDFAHINPQRHVWNCSIRALPQAVV